MQELPLNYQRLESALQPPKAYRDVCHDRYHDEQAERGIDTAAKKLARESGCKTVVCPCGQEFPAAVQ